jgi:hypothetical protein
MNIDPTAAGYHGIAVIARAEQATYRKPGDRLPPLVDAAEAR